RRASTCREPTRIPSSGGLRNPEGESERVRAQRDTATQERDVHDAARNRPAWAKTGFTFGVRPTVPADASTSAACAAADDVEPACFVAKGFRGGRRGLWETGATM